MLAILAPGQGSQRPGMLTPWLELPAFADQLRWYSAVTGLDLTQLGSTGSADDIRDTAITQPLLVATALAAMAPLNDAARPLLTPDQAASGLPLADLTAGHSVGEFAAAALARALTAEAALVLTTERGRAMAEAAAATATSMAAVLGGDQDAVLARLQELGLEPANRNGAGQIVAAGPADAIAALVAEPPAGARVRQLEVAGAFHTRFMAPARDTLAALLPAVPVRDPLVPLLSNADGTAVATGTDLLDRLVNQVAAPVRWDLCMEAIAASGVTGVLELPPAGTLTGLVKRALPKIATFALKSPEDLPAAAEFVAAHRAHRSVTPAPPWRLVVAPQAGVFTRDPLELGITLSPSTELGRLRARGAEQPIRAPYGGVLVEWLADDGDPVAPGQPLARLHPEA